MARFDAVIFDWMLTLADYPPPADHVARALQVLSRPVDDQAVREITEALTEAKTLPDVQAAEAIEDTSPEAHYRSEQLLYRRAGLDQELADVLYGLLGTIDFHPCYQDSQPTLAALAAQGIRLGVVSDIHVDLRVHAEAFGFGRLVQAWALSCELGIQKPDPAIFAAALSELGTEPERTLMVGDRPSRDGAAAELGMPCLILPGRPTANVRGLAAVLDLVGVEHRT